MSFVCQSDVLVCHTYVIRMSLVRGRILYICTRMLFVCQSYVLVCHLYITRMSLYHTDMLMISETKLNESFSTRQFLLGGYSVPFRFDKNENGGGILLYVREDIPSKLLLINNNIKVFVVEINLRKKKKWLLSCSYNPTKMQISNHLAELSQSTDLYLTKYDQLLFLRDFNAGVEDSSVKNFCLVIALQV